MLLVILAVTALFAMVGTTIAAQNEATPKAQDNGAVGEAEVKQMLPLMDQDKDGKVSKQDFMKFMEAEFDRLDKKKEGKLDVKKLTQPFPLADLSVPFVVHETIVSGCTVKGRSTLAVRMPFSVKADRGGQRSLRRRRDHAP